MIVIHHFKEMADLHQAGKLPFRIVQEVALVLLGLCDYHTPNTPEASAITQKEIDWLQARPTDIDFLTYLGGFVQLCETTRDLAEVTSMDIEFAQQHGRWPNCTEAVIAWDDCRILLNADGSADYALLFAATNNAGGPSWFLPRHLWQAAQIDAQIEANHPF